MRKPKVTTRCPANQYTSDRERIIEFSSAYGGGLISFYLRTDGTLAVQVYRTDPTVTVTHSRDDEHGVSRPLPLD